MTDSASPSAAAPKPYESPALWRGDALARSPGWRHVLSAEEVAEIRDAISHGRGSQLESVDRAAFPLPSLGPRLAAARRDLEEGPGSFLLRGWPAAEHSVEDNTRVFWGLSRHLGTPVSQSAQGEHVFHVQDSGFQIGHPQARGPNTRRGLSFHCDRCDVIGFMCIRQALRGGESYLVSSVAVHNEISARRPDLLRELYQPWYYKTHNVDRGNPDPWCRQPIFAVEQGHFVGYLLRVLIDRAYELPELPDMTPRQREALDLVEDVCAEDDLHFRFRQEPGDLLFVNNFVNFHSRSEFEDHAEPEKKRLLLRIWLSVPNSRPLPPLFAGSFGRVGAGEIRGGIHPAPVRSD